VELSLISIISLLVVCSAVLLFKKAAHNETLSLVAAKFRPALIAIGAAVIVLGFVIAFKLISPIKFPFFPRAAFHDTVVRCLIEMADRCCGLR